jgi:hypothetical protein
VGASNSVMDGIEVAVVRIGPAPHERDLPCRGALQAQRTSIDEAKRAFDAMMGMKKIDVAAIKAARRG